MEITSHLLAIAGAFVLVLSYNLWRVRIGSHKSKGMLALAPKPSGALPIIGHLRKLGGKDPIARITLAAMADQYGPIFKIQFGTKSTIVISNHEAVKECFTTNDKALAGRPRSSHGKYLAYNYAAFGFINYGQFWLKMRKITMLELFSSRWLETLKNVQVIEVNNLIKDLYTLCMSKKHNNQAKVVISEWIERLTFNIITKKISGNRYFGNLNDGNDGKAQRIGKLIKEFDEYQVKAF